MPIFTIIALLGELLIAVAGTGYFGAMTFEVVTSTWTTVRNIVLNLIVSTAFAVWLIGVVGVNVYLIANIF